MSSSNLDLVEQLAAGALARAAAEATRREEEEARQTRRAARAAKLPWKRRRSTDESVEAPLPEDVSAPDVKTGSSDSVVLGREADEPCADCQSLTAERDLVITQRDDLQRRIEVARDERTEMLAALRRAESEMRSNATHSDSPVEEPTNSLDPRASTELASLQAQVAHLKIANEGLQRELDEALYSSTGTPTTLKPADGSERNQGQNDGSDDVQVSGEADDGREQTLELMPDSDGDCVPGEGVCSKATPSRGQVLAAVAGAAAAVGLAFGLGGWLAPAPEAAADPTPPTVLWNLDAAEPPPDLTEYLAEAQRAVDKAAASALQAGEAAQRAHEAVESQAAEEEAALAQEAAEAAEQARLEAEAALRAAQERAASASQLPPSSPAPGDTGPGGASPSPPSVAVTPEPVPPAAPAAVPPQSPPVPAPRQSVTHTFTCTGVGTVEITATGTGEVSVSAAGASSSGAGVATITVEAAAAITATASADADLNLAFATRVAGGTCQPG